MRSRGVLQFSWKSLCSGPMLVLGEGKAAPTKYSMIDSANPIEYTQIFRDENFTNENVKETT